MNIIDTHKVAIVTKFLGATNYKPSRVKATANGNTTTVGFHVGLNEDMFDPYRRAAEALCKKMDWKGDLIGGAVDNGEIFLFLPTEKMPW